MAVTYTMKAEWNNLSGLYQPESITVKYSTGIGGSCDNIYVLSSAKNWISDKPLLFEFQICDILFDTINHYDYTISTIGTVTKIVFTEKEESIQTNNKTKPLIINKSIDLIYKKGNYSNTYLIADITGLPDSATLFLTDAQNNQLYSPFNVNGDYGKTACTAETTNTKIAIPLPAQYNGDFWTDYPAGTYNWKLRYHGDDLYKAKDYPLAIQIVDFNTWEVQNPSIYPNEDISSKIRTYANTIPSVTDLLTTNATYDANTGIINYPNNDIIHDHHVILEVRQLLPNTSYKFKVSTVFGQGRTSPATSEKAIHTPATEGIDTYLWSPVRVKINKYVYDNVQQMQKIEGFHAIEQQIDLDELEYHKTEDRVREFGSSCVTDVEKKEVKHPKVSYIPITNAEMKEVVACDLLINTQTREYVIRLDK